MGVFDWTFLLLLYLKLTGEVDLGWFIVFSPVVLAFAIGSLIGLSKNG